MAGGKKISPEREQTDTSLRVEREKTDAALAQRQATVERDADEVVQRARENADAVLSAARDEADHRLAGAAPAALHATVAEQRVREDEALEVERSAADETVRRERDESARALATLLPLERDKTDRFLLTERVRADDAVSNRDDFLGIVSHDLRNLLAGIVMGAALLSKRAGEGEEGRRTVAEADRIQRYAARMNRLIGDLIDVASIDAGRLAVTAVNGDPAALVAEAVDTFRPVAAARGVSLEVEHLERPLLARFDHDRLLQVLANLITNAIKFTPAGGHIRVRGERVGDELRFSVSDTGPGIPGGMLEAIFERFCQVDQNDRRGVGLGLYISRCIVDAHGGRIWAESEVGAGSTLVFELPGAPPVAP